MPVYATIYRYVDSPDVLAEHRPAHREYIGTLVGAGGLIASGRMEGGDQTSALLLFSAQSADEVAQALNQDPLWKLGLIETREILEWTVSSGSLGLDGGH